LGGCIEGVFAQQLLHQPLPQLQQLHIYLGVQLPVLHLAHLTRLRKIAGGGSEHPFYPAERSVLPAQLQHLQLMVSDPDLEWVSGRALACVLPLQQLQQLELLAEFAEQQPLLQLAQLPALQHLTLRYRGMVLAAKAAAAWLHLPQLHELRVEEGFESRPPTPDEMETVLQGVADCTGLTKLVLFCNAAEMDVLCAAATQVTSYCHTASTPSYSSQLRCAVLRCAVVVSDYHWYHTNSAEWGHVTPPAAAGHDGTEGLRGTVCVRA
jgi:hypothetical protein